MLGPRQPLQTIMPIPQGALCRLEPCRGGRWQAIQLGVGFDGIAHPLDQQTQAVAVVGGIVQGVIQGFPLLGQTLLDTPAQAFKQPLALTGA
ncbi:hypothetical protein D3C71_1641120 [compost metagenome]